MIHDIIVQIIDCKTTDIHMRETKYTYTYIRLIHVSYKSQPLYIPVRWFHPEPYLTLYSNYNLSQVGSLCKFLFLPGLHRIHSICSLDHNVVEVSQGHQHVFSGRSVTIGTLPVLLHVVKHRAS